MDCVVLAEDHELRLIRGLWYEVRLASLPKAQYRAVTESRKVLLKPYARRSRAIEMEITERRLVSPPVFDMASGVRVPVGPDTDNEKAWREYRRRHLDGRYAISKRQLSNRELRAQGLSNASPETVPTR